MIPLDIDNTTVMRPVTEVLLAYAKSWLLAQHDSNICVLDIQIKHRIQTRSYKVVIGTSNERKYQMRFPRLHANSSNQKPEDFDPPSHQFTKQSATSYD